MSVSPYIYTSGNHMFKLLRISMCYSYSDYLEKGLDMSVQLLFFPSAQQRKKKHNNRNLEIKQVQFEILNTKISNHIFYPEIRLNPLQIIVTYKL